MVAMTMVAMMPMLARIPMVEIANDADPLSVGGPYREIDAFDSVHDSRVGTQEIVHATMVPLSQKEAVIIT